MMNNHKISDRIAQCQDDFETTYFESIFNTPKHINLQNGCVGFLAMSEDWTKSLPLTR